MIPASGVGDLVNIDGIMNSKKEYSQILIRHAMPSGKHQIGNCLIFQYDSKTIHTANAVKAQLI